jgi:antirestriction protein ArdC
MKPEFKTRLQVVYSYILGGANRWQWRRGYAVKEGSKVDMGLTANSGYLCKTFDVEPHDVGFSGNPGSRTPEIEAFVKSLGVEVIEKEITVPAYNQEKVVIWMPRFRSYISPEAYYSDLFHELAHYARDLGGYLDSANTEREVFVEEMIAQLGSELLMVKFGVSNAHSSACYVGGYLDKHGGADRREIFNRACRGALEAVDILEKSS